MRPGPLVRRLFGSHEHDIAELYRRTFVDLDKFARRIASWVPQAHQILEVGCGEGAMTERLVSIYPMAKVIATDISSNAGRLYRGPSANVDFRVATVEEIASEAPGTFDLVVLADVIHHVPVSARASLMAGVRDAMSEGGRLVFKDWLVSATPIHWLCYASDRFITGDRVEYCTVAGVNAILGETFGPGAVRDVDRIAPWKNNIAFLVGC